MSLRLLIMQPHPDMPGGVVNYIEGVKRQLKQIASDIDFSFFVIGQRPGEAGGLSTLTRLASDAWHLAGELRRGRYDVVHMNPSLNLKSVLRDFVLFWICCGFSKAGIIVFFRGWDEGLEQKIARSRFLTWLFCRSLARAGHVIVLAPAFAEFLKRVGVDDKAISIQTTMVRDIGLEPLLDARERDGAKKDLIVLMARLVREKGLYELLEAWKRLEGRHRDITLVIAGVGPEREPAMKMAQRLIAVGRVAFPGQISGDAKADVLARSLVFALPSYHSEGMPNAVLEGMAAGAVMLTTPVGGIVTVVRDPENGVLLDRVDAETVFAALEAMLADREALMARGAANRREASAKYSEASVTRRLIDVYRAVAVRL